MKLFKNDDTIYRILGNVDDESDLSYTKTPKDIF